MAKKSRQTFKYLENERVFKMKQKAFFIIFEGLSFEENKKNVEGESLTLGSRNFSLDLCYSSSIAMLSWRFQRNKNMAVAKNLRVTINLYKKRCLPIITWNKNIHRDKLYH